MGSGQPDYMNITLLKGVDSGGNLVTIAVDEDGNLISVMKGQYAGSLKNLAVDEQGRMLAVLTDPEDVFGNPNYMGAGELAARLGSVTYYNKTGNVFFMDGFEHTLNKWAEGGSGTGHAAAVDNGYAKDGEFSCKITAGQGNNEMGNISHTGGGIVLSKIGFEVSFTIDSNLKDFQFLWDIETGTYEHLAGVYYYPITQLLRFANSAGGISTFATGVELDEGLGIFHTLKFVINMSTGYYDYCLLDNVLYDMSSWQYELGANNAAPSHRADIIATNSVATNQSFYVDNVIFTQNEG